MRPSIATINDSNAALPTCAQLTSVKNKALPITDIAVAAAAAIASINVCSTHLIISFVGFCIIYSF